MLSGLLFTLAANAADGAEVAEAAAEATETSAETFSFAKFWNDIVTFFTTKYWNILLFFLILVVGVVLIKTLVALLKKGFKRSKLEQISQSLILHLIKFCLYLTLILVLLALMGVKITGIITALSAGILAIGMALKENLANLANGIIIVTMHMFNKGDLITSGDTHGRVQDINILFTTVSTNDNKRVMIPNSIIVNKPLQNFGINGTRRVDFTFSVSYESDVEEVKRIVKDVMHSYNKIKLDPEPFCRLKTLGSSSLDFFANCWCDSDDYWDVYYYVTENVFNELKRGGVSVPFTQTEVRIRNDEAKLPVIEERLPERGEELPARAERPEFPFSIISDINKKKEEDKKKREEKKRKKAEEKAVVPLAPTTGPDADDD